MKLDNANRLANLTPAQRKIFAHLLRGESALEIATALRRSTHTVINHTRRVYEAFGVTSHPKLMARFVDHSALGKTRRARPPSRRR
jgi:DNA-binding CsgD family transcriptional regulator